MLIINVLNKHEGMNDKMADLTKVELQNLRHLITANDTAYQKLIAYANNSVDPQIKQMFTRSSTGFTKY